MKTDWWCFLTEKNKNKKITAASEARLKNGEMNGKYVIYLMRGLDQVKTQTKQVAIGRNKRGIYEASPGIHSYWQQSINWVLKYNLC